MFWPPNIFHSLLFRIEQRIVCRWFLSKSSCRPHNMQKGLSRRPIRLRCFPRQLCWTVSLKTATDIFLGQTGTWLPVVLYGCETWSLTCSSSSCLAKKNISCCFYTNGSTRLPGKTSPSYWSPRQSLLHGMWPTRGHGQKLPTTMSCSIGNNREWKILGGQNKNVNCVINCVTDYCDKSVNLVLYFSVLIGC